MFKVKVWSKGALNLCLRLKSTWGIRSIAPVICKLSLDGGDWLGSVPGRFKSGERTVYMHSTKDPETHVSKNIRF